MMSAEPIVSLRSTSFELAEPVRFLDGAAGLSHAVPHPKRVLGLFAVVALIFFDVSGGPFGSEEAVKYGGPLLTILGFVVFPLIWSIPEALVTAELATAFPENSGYVAWVTEAFGPFWGFMEGFLSWVSGVIDNSVYPVLFVNYLTNFISWDSITFWEQWMLVVFISLSLTYLNYRGLTVVGDIAMVITIFIFVPFVILFFCSLPHLDTSNWLRLWDGGHWEDVFSLKAQNTQRMQDFVNVLFWNLNYWSSVSTLAGEVSDPSRTFPRALGIAVVLVVTLYLGPILTATGLMGMKGLDVKSSDDFMEENAVFETIANKVGGRWLGGWILLAAAFSQAGQFQAEMSSDSFQLSGMAERGMLPRVFATRSKHGTPIYGILASAMGVMMLGTLEFIQIVELLNMVYCVACLLGFAAFLWLRYKHPHLHRPYRVPLGLFGCTMMLLPGSIMTLYLLVAPFGSDDPSDWVMIGVTCTMCLLGAAMFFLLEQLKTKGVCKFVKTLETISEDTDPLLSTRTTPYTSTDAEQGAEFKPPAHI